MKKKSSYQVMTSILSNYEPSMEEKLSLNSFFYCRYLSGNIETSQIGNIINIYHDQLPLNIQYDIGNILVNKKKIKFIQVPKKEKHDSELVDNVCRYYKISIDNAKQYINLMNEEQKEKFKNLYKGA